MSLLELFCQVDDFCVLFLAQLRKNALPDTKNRRNRRRSMCLSEVITILIRFHHSGYRTFKDFYIKYVSVAMRAEFPRLVSYNRFIEFIPSAFVALGSYAKRCLSQSTGISFIDSTALKVCHNRRIKSHRVFAGLAQRGKTSVGWFYGFKLHLVVNHLGEIIQFQMTPGNVDDRVPVFGMLQKVFGKVFGDKGYISKELAQKLQDELGVFLCTRQKKNSKPVKLPEQDEYLLGKRGMIESIIDLLKNESQIEHTRHRSVTNGFANVIAGIVAYCHRKNKPSVVPNPNLITEN